MRDFVSQGTSFKQSVYQRIAGAHQNALASAIADGNFALASGSQDISGTHQAHRNHRRVLYRSQMQAIGTNLPSNVGRWFWTAFGVYPQDLNGPAYAACSFGKAIRVAIREKGTSSNLAHQNKASIIYLLMTRDNLTAKNYVTFYSNSALTVGERVELDLCKNGFGSNGSLSNAAPCNGSSDSDFVKTVELEVTRSNSPTATGLRYHELAPVN